MTPSHVSGHPNSTCAHIRPFKKKKKKKKKKKEKKEKKRMVATDQESGKESKPGGCVAA